MFSKQKLYENTFLLIYLRVQLKGYFFLFLKVLNTLIFLQTEKLEQLYGPNILMIILALAVFCNQYLFFEENIFFV